MVDVIHLFIFVEQDELLSYMRDDLIKQRRMWKVIHDVLIYFQNVYTVLLSILIILFVYGCTEEEWGMGPNVVRVLTYGRYNYSMAIPSLCTSIVVVFLTVSFVLRSYLQVLFVLFPWMRIAYYFALLIPFLFEVIWLILRLWKWKSITIGTPLLPLVVTILPIVAYYIDSGNRKLWIKLDSLEDIRSKYKSV